MAKKIIAALLILVVAAGLVFAQGAEEAKSSKVKIQLMQWFVPELPAGQFESLIAQFEAENPNIEVEIVSIANGNYKDQLIAGIATGTLCDVFGLDEKYVVDIADGVMSLDKYLAKCSFADDISVLTQVNGETKCAALVEFMYPLFCNMDILNAYGYTEAPKTRSEFAAIAKAVTDPSKSQYGWVLPYPIKSSTGTRIETMSLYWTNGYSMKANGQPNLEGNEDLIRTLEFVKDMYDTAVSPGAFNKTEQDKLEEFASGRIAFMFNSLACINKLNERAPNLNYALVGCPQEDGYTGAPSIRNADWAIGIYEGTKHPEEAWKLVEFLLRSDINQKLSSMANGLPGNKTATPDWVSSDNPMFQVAFELFQNCRLVNEFLGIANSDAMGEALAESIQNYLAGKCTAAEALAQAQAKWAPLWK